MSWAEAGMVFVRIIGTATEVVGAVKTGTTYLILSTLEIFARGCGLTISSDIRRALDAGHRGREAKAAKDEAAANLTNAQATLTIARAARIANQTAVRPATPQARDNAAVMRTSEELARAVQVMRLQSGEVIITEQSLRALLGFVERIGEAPPSSNMSAPPSANIETAPGGHLTIGASASIEGAGAEVRAEGTVSPPPMDLEGVAAEAKAQASLGTLPIGEPGQQE